MPRQTPLQRWSLLALLAVLASLFLHDTAPQIAYRIARHAALGSNDREQIHSAELSRRQAEVQAATLHRLSREIGKCVVRVLEPRAEPVDDRVLKPSRGFGVIVDQRALAVTSLSVVDDLPEIQLALAGRDEPLPARIVAWDLVSDLAVLEFEPPENCQLDVRRISTAPPALGEFVLSLADFHDPRDSIQIGQVMTRGRVQTRVCLQEADYIGTDAATALNIGGPLLNLRGEIVGVCSAECCAADPVRGFVVPAMVADQIISDLVRLGRVRRGWLGAFLHADVLPGPGLGGPAAATRVAHVDYVVPGSPAATVGLRAGDDIMLMTQHLPVTSIADLQRLVLSTVPPAELRLSFVRDGHFHVVSVPVETQPLLPPALPGEREWGIQILCPHEPEPFDPDEPLRGVVLSAVGKRLGEQGVRPGDAIVGLNRIPIPNLESFCREVSAALSSRMPPRLEVLRKGESQPILVEFPAATAR